MIIMRIKIRNMLTVLKDEVKVTTADKRSKVV